MIDLICQIWIIVFALPAVFMISSENKKVAKYGYLLVLLSQPGYIITSIMPVFKFGLFIMTVVFTLGWAKGFYIYWIVTWRKSR